MNVQHHKLAGFSGRKAEVMENCVCDNANRRIRIAHDGKNAMNRRVSNLFAPGQPLVPRSWKSGADCLQGRTLIARQTHLETATKAGACL